MAAEHFASGAPPPAKDCGAKGISCEQHREGTCFEGNRKLVVVNEHSVLRLDSLEAEVRSIGERKRPSGTPGRAAAKRALVVFDLAITNRTDEPQAFAASQTLLLLKSSYGEDVARDENHEPRSFLARDREIPPHGTEYGTVTFAVPSEELEALRQQGNIDFGNFGAAGTGGDFEPEAIFGGSEYGVIRTYQ